MPHTKAMGAGLFEVRAKVREGIGRAFYCTLVGERIVILHAIIKKSDRPLCVIWPRHVRGKRRYRHDS
jgi:phage-related protein